MAGKARGNTSISNPNGENSEGRSMLQASVPIPCAFLPCATGNSVSLFLTLSFSGWGTPKIVQFSPWGSCGRELTALLAEVSGPWWFYNKVTERLEMKEWEKELKIRKSFTTRCNWIVMKTWKGKRRGNWGYMVGGWRFTCTIRSCRSFSKSLDSSSALSLVSFSSAMLPLFFGGCFCKTEKENHPTNPSHETHNSAALSIQHTQTHTAHYKAP